MPKKKEETQKKENGTHNEELSCKEWCPCYFFEVPSNEESYVEKHRPRCSKPVFFAEVLNEKNVEQAKDAKIISVFIWSKVTEALLNKMPNLKMITTRSTGYDHIDLEACKERNITVCNVPSYGENTVAEHTFALILSLSRNVHKAYLRTTRQDFSLQGLRGFDLKHKTIGIVGTGHIGLHVAKMARGFGMNVMAFDVKHSDFMADMIGFRYVDMDILLRSSDIVSLHAPLNEHTKHMISMRELKLMKPTALLINTGRGGLVETEDLVEALNQKQIAGAGLDVLEGEGFIKDDWQLLHKTGASEENLKTLLLNHKLLNHENVVITPHIAFDSHEAVQRIYDTTIDNIRRFISEEKVQNQVV